LERSVGVGAIAAAGAAPGPFLWLPRLVTQNATAAIFTLRISGHQNT
jgi:hypothetical protein